MNIKNHQKTLLNICCLLASVLGVGANTSFGQATSAQIDHGDYWDPFNLGRPGGSIEIKWSIKGGVSQPGDSLDLYQGDTKKTSTPVPAGKSEDAHFRLHAPQVGGKYRVYYCTNGKRIPTNGWTQYGWDGGVTSSQGAVRGQKFLVDFELPYGAVAQAGDTINIEAVVDQQARDILRSEPVDREMYGRGKGQITMQGYPIILTGTHLIWYCQNGEAIAGGRLVMRPGPEGKLELLIASPNSPEINQQYDISFAISGTTIQVRDTIDIYNDKGEKIGSTSVAQYKGTSGGKLTALIAPKNPGTYSVRYCKDGQQLGSSLSLPVRASALQEQR